jgi:hypothetical protein
VVNIEIDKVAYKMATRKLAHIPKGINRATKNAINRTISATNKFIHTELKDTYTVKVSEIKHGLEKENATISKLSGKVVASGPVLRASGFKNDTSIPKEYVVSIKRRGKRALPEQAFVAKMPKNNGKQRRQHKGIFIRKGKERLGIRELTGPSIPGMASSKPIRGKVTKVMYKKFNERFDHEVNYLLSKK